MAQISAECATGSTQGILERVYLERKCKKCFAVHVWFRGHRLSRCDTRLPVEADDLLCIVDSTDEPKTCGVDKVADQVKTWRDGMPAAVVAIGGGTVLDTGKAVSNLLTNPGLAEDYQGWDLVKQPGVFKIGVPTLSGTGSESSRTCVLMNPQSRIKLGMNSDYTVFDQLILDPDLSVTVPRDQFFFTGMDTYFHCMEYLNGQNRTPVVDAYAEKAVDLCRQVFTADEMQSTINRERMMVASYFGGCAAGNVGVVHPVSAGLSVALGQHHGVANCLAMSVMDEFYPRETDEFRRLLDAQSIQLPSGICCDLSDDVFDLLYASTIVHSKPLENALGPQFRDILSPAKLCDMVRGL